MNRNRIVKIGAIVMIFSLLITIFVGALAATAAPSSSTTFEASSIAVSTTASANSLAHRGSNPDIDGDGIANDQDGNPTSTNNVDSIPPKDARVETAWQIGGGLAVLAVLGWLVALPYLRKRKGTSSRSVGSRSAKDN